jgi:hypothetical protein
MNSRLAGKQNVTFRIKDQYLFAMKRS